MSSPERQSVLSTLLVVVLVIILTAIPINGLTRKKLDENLVPGTPDPGTKCTACSSCENPCSKSPPPPPPSPPPSPKKPPSQYCPPPPPPPFYYITGPPGNLYPLDPYYSCAGRNFAVGIPLVVGCGVVGLLAFWRL